VSASISDTKSAELYARALNVLPGGVNSPVRAMRSIGREPIFIERGAGAEITDVDGNTYVDYVCSWGPLIHGHAHPQILEAVVEAAALGTTFGAATAIPRCSASSPGRISARSRSSAALPGWFAAIQRLPAAANMRAVLGSFSGDVFAASSKF